MQTSHRRVGYVLVALLVTVAVLASPLGAVATSGTDTPVTASDSSGHTLLGAVADTTPLLGFDWGVKAYDPPDFVS